MEKLRAMEAEKAMKENESLHRAMTGHLPYFQLTEEGARALKDFLKKRPGAVDLMGGSESEPGIQVELMREFLEGIGVNLAQGDKVMGKEGLWMSDTHGMYALLGAASGGFSDRHMIGIDTLVLDKLANTRYANKGR